MSNILICYDFFDRMDNSTKEGFVPSDELKALLEEHSITELIAIVLVCFTFAGTFFYVLITQIVSAYTYSKILSFDDVKDDLTKYLTFILNNLSVGIQNYSHDIDEITNNMDPQQTESEKEQKQNKLSAIQKAKLHFEELEKKANEFKTKKFNEDKSIIRKYQIGNIFIFVLQLIFICLLILGVFCSDKFSPNICFQSIYAIVKIKEESKDGSTVPFLKEEFKQKFQEKQFNSAFFQMFGLISFLLIMYSICALIVYKVNDTSLSSFDKDFPNVLPKRFSINFRAIVSFVIEALLSNLLFCALVLYFAAKDYFKVIEQYIKEQEDYLLKNSPAEQIFNDDSNLETNLQN